MGIFSFDGAPVDRELLEYMTCVMNERAPDDHKVWVSGSLGFGHAMLRMLPDFKLECQPCTLDGRVWVTADVRIDGRAELVAKLYSAGCDVKRDVLDAELILYAYAAFGESFLEHLIGDYAFALWDSRSKQLICVRDHLGVRPCFYVKTNKLFLFASDIDALLCHPAVSRELDGEAIGDFLMFGSFLDPEQTIYRNIRRLKAGNRIVVSEQGVSFKQYWELPQGSEILYRKDLDYVEQFQAIFRQSVEDRLTGGCVALELSGGMDSTAIAAISAANALITGRRLTAYTITCNDLLPDDQEGYFAGMVASYLNLPLSLQSSGDYALFERMGTSQLSSAEPLASPDWAMGADSYEQVIRSGARVLLTGQGGDAVFGVSGAYYVNLLLEGRLVRFLDEIRRHVINTGSLAGTGLRSACFGTKPWQPQFPDFIDKGFCEEFRLTDRWNEGWRVLNAPGDAYHQLKRPWTGQMLEGFESLKLPLVVRHPFFDIRLVTFLLGLPNYIKYDKRLLRESMRGWLPEPVRTRPKTPLVGDHIRARFSEEQGKLASSDLKYVVGTYVDRLQYMHTIEQYRCGNGVKSTWLSWQIVAPRMLNTWLGGLKYAEETKEHANC